MEKVPNNLEGSALILSEERARELAEEARSETKGNGIAMTIAIERIVMRSDIPLEDRVKAEEQILKESFMLSADRGIANNLKERDKKHAKHWMEGRENY